MSISVYLLHMIPVISIKSLSFSDFSRCPVFTSTLLKQSLFLTVWSRSVMVLAIFRVLSKGNCSSYLSSSLRCPFPYHVIPGPSWWLGMVMWPKGNQCVHWPAVYHLTLYKKLCSNKDESNKLGWSESVSQDFEGERKSESGSNLREQGSWELDKKWTQREAETDRSW